MSTINFNRFSRADVRESNVRLQGESTQLKIKVTPVLDAEGVDAWEGEGGAVAPPPYEETIEQAYRTQVRVRGARKQRAARMFVPRESIKIVRVAEPMTPAELAQQDPELGQAVQIASLEAKVKALLGLVQAREAEATRKARSIEELVQRANERRVR